MDWMMSSRSCSLLDISRGMPMSAKNAPWLSTNWSYCAPVVADCIYSHFIIIIFISHHLLRTPTIHKTVNITSDRCNRQARMITLISGRPLFPGPNSTCVQCDLDCRLSDPEWTLIWHVLSTVDAARYTNCYVCKYNMPTNFQVAIATAFPFMVHFASMFERRVWPCTLAFWPTNCQQKDTPLILKQMSRRMLDSPRCCFIPFIGWKFDASMHTSVRCIGEINRWIKQRSHTKYVCHKALNWNINI